MVRHARTLVQQDAIGPVRLVQVEYIQSGMATRVEGAPSSNRLRWVLDPARSGLSLVQGAIGCHAQHLAAFVSGREVTRVCADVGALMPGRVVDDYAAALLELDDGVRGTFVATQAAAGSENDIRLRVYGERGHLDWSHRQSSYLTVALQGEAARTIARGDPGVAPAEPGSARAPRGHPEGLREAFATLYDALARERMLRALGEAPPPRSYPTIDDGVRTMAFIEACVASSQQRRWVEVAAASP
jgi:predicted dehydrogenase